MRHLLVVLLAARATALASRAVGVQPRGNAVLRDAQRTRRRHAPTATPRQTARLRTEAMEHFGLNVNDYWTLQSGTIADAIPAPTPELRRKQREQLRKQEDSRLLKAERRLQEQLREPDRRSAAKAAARLCAALDEARRRGSRNQPLLAKAGGLLSLLERAAADEHERAMALRGGRAARAMSPPPIDQDDGRVIDEDEDARRAALIHALALHWQRHC